MSYAINSTNSGWRAINSKNDLLPGEIYSDTQPVLAPTIEQIVAEYESAVQSSLDAVAASWQYESILSAASYANSTVPQFKAEALALIAWRDQVWAGCYSEMSDIQAGTNPMPASPAAFVASLPPAPVRPS